MKFHSSIIPREKRSPIHHFQSKQTALDHLKAYSIEPQDGRFIILAERTYADKTFDALDYLMYDYGYQVHWV